MTDAASVLVRSIEELKADLLSVEMALFREETTGARPIDEILREIIRLKSNQADPNRSRMKQAFDAP